MKSIRIKYQINYSLLLDLVAYTFSKQGLKFIFKSVYLVTKKCVCFQFFYETVSGPIEFGPVFHKDFLMQVFKLQKQIEEVSFYSHNLISL